MKSSEFNEKENGKRGEQRRVYLDFSGEIDPTEFAFAQWFSDLEVF